MNSPEFLSPPEGGKVGAFGRGFEGGFCTFFVVFFMPGILTGKEMRLKMANNSTKIWVNSICQQEILVVFGPYFHGPLLNFP